LPFRPGDAADELVAAEPAAAVAVDEERGWPPLLYACYSTWHHFDPSAAQGLAQVARLLIDAGASPDTNDGGRPRYRSSLKGSVEANNPAVTEVLLAAGAHPDPGQPIVEAIGRGDHRCLRLLLTHGARVERTWAVGAAVDRDDAGALALLLDALAAAGAPVDQIATEARPDAADDATEIDRFLGACRCADRAQAEQILADHPDLLERMADDDWAALVDAAATGPVEAVALMLDLGFPVDSRQDGEAALHNAAYHGHAAAVRVLLEKGADVDVRDENFDGTPLGFATVGSGEQAGRDGDWIRTVRTLVEAGASTTGVWLPDKPPSEEVAEVLLGYGIRPDLSGVEEAPADPPEAPSPKATGVMADIAEALEAAHSAYDLELLGSLLHPEVRWSGYCTNKDQVLDWYRSLLAERSRSTVDSVEVDGDAVILGLSVSRTAEGARPAPAQRLYQVFTVSGAQIVDIHGYPDRAGAHARPRPSQPQQR
jgi:ankyrin repeat protein